MNFIKGLDPELENKLIEIISTHRERFKRLFMGRYKELLPSLISYQNINNEKVNVNFLKVENALRSGYDVAIGLTSENSIQILGFIKSKESSEDPNLILGSRPLRKKDITFIIPEHLKEKYYKEITNYDNCRTGNFIVLRNKTLNYISDYEVLEHYIDELSEIQLSRYSISMQAKISTIFKGNPNDTSMSDLVTRLYYGDPYVLANKTFDPDENIVKIDNSSIISAFSELKTEYQHKLSELLNMLGINSLAIDKESGVSDTEAKSNTGFTTSNANIYLDSRNEPLSRLNKRYGFNIQAVYNDKVSSEIQGFNDTVELKDGESK